MRVHFRLLLLLSLTCALSACGEAPAPASPAPAPAPADAVAAAGVPEAARLDTDALRQRAAEALAVNRLFAPAGNNAVEDYLALRERLPEDLAVATALLDLAPYVVIGAEQAQMAGQFDEAQRLIDLLLRMDAEAPAAPRLREGLLSARQAAEVQIENDRQATEAAAAASAAREAAARATAARAATAPPRPIEAVAAAPAPTPEPLPVAAPLAAPPPTAPAPITARPAPAARPLVAQTAPRFPEQALRRRLEGSVQLQLQVAADGTVLAAEVVASSHAMFEREAVLAARRWRFAPAPATSTERVAVAFRQPEA